MLAILAASVIAVAAPAALVFYVFTRDAAIGEAEQFAATSADRRVLGLNYTLRLAGTSLARFDLMLHDRLAFAGTEEEVSRFRSVLERNDAGMLVTRRQDFNGRTQAGVVFHPNAPTTDEVYRLHARTQRLMSLYAGAVVPPLDSMWLLTREQTAVIYMPRDPEFVYRATTGNNYLASEWVTLGDPKTNPQRGMRWTHAAYDPVLRTWLVSAVRPFDLDGAWVGNIGHDLFLDELVQRLVGADQLPDTQHFLVGADGDPIIAGQWQSALLENKLTGDARRGFDETVQHLQAVFAGRAEDGAAVRVDLNGRPVSVLMRTLPETGWRYYVVTPIASITGSASKALLLFGLTAAIAIVLVVAVTHLLVQRQIVNPIRRLADAVRTFAAGKTDARATVDRADDIGDVSQAFNAMADYIAGSHRDLTKAQQELQHRNAALVDANRTKSNFLANMSHELRTPLNAIIGFAEILRYQMFGPLGNDRYVGYVDDIQRSGQHLLSLINDILDMSKIEAGRQALKLERQVLSPLIERSIRMAQPIAERRSVNLKFHANGADLSANCDSRAVTQMVINLVSNAVKFSPPGGTVDIRLEPSSLGGAKISVADGGPGIEEEVLPHLFEAYAHRAAQTTQRQDGVGLGLAITKALVELHNGQIRVVTQPGRGTTMTLELPPAAP
ncbi:MAG TPA: ATP-binding protein [Dongiaceae bacterium]|nr:ATP-binding protein [Dongiaceae bacterium]